MHLNRNDAVTRLRGDRQSAPSIVGRDRATEKSQTNRGRKEKTDPLIGWKVDNTFPDIDFARWTKRKEAIDLKQEDSFNSKREWNPYVCTLLKKCRAIENIEQYISQSLSVSLKPQPVEKQVPKVPFKHAKSENFTKSRAYATIHEEVRKPEGLDLLKRGIEREIQAKDESDETSPTVQNGAKAAVNAKANGPTVFTETEIDKQPNGVHESEDLPPLLLNRLANDTPLSFPESYCDSVSCVAGGLSSRKSEVGDSKAQEIKQLPPKFGYTQSNRNDVSAIYVGDNNKTLPNDTGQNHKLNDTENAEYETISEIPKFGSGNQKPVRKYGIVKRTLQATSVAFVPGFQGHVGKKQSHKYFSMSRSESNIKELNDESAVINAHRLDDDAEQSLSGMSTASIRTARRVGSSQSDLSRTKYTGNNFQSQSFPDISAQDDNANMSQKQVMLVLKKVTLQDNDLDEAAENANGAAIKRNALTSAIARKYGLLTNGALSDGERPSRALSGKTNNSFPTTNIRSGSGNKINENEKLSSARGSNFAIGELLPAVDNSIRNSMPARNYRSMEHYGLTDMAVTGKDKMLPYEDSIIMMKEGIEMLRIKERDGTLGHQGFRPQHGKTPLQRAKENAHKRLYTQIEPKAVQNDDVGGNKARWESSGAHLYNGTNSRPSSVKHNEDFDQIRDNSGQLLRKFNHSASETKKPSGRAINLENGKLQMQHVSNALASRLHGLARQQANRETVQDLMQRAGVK